jgi:hypothetical protein
MARVAALLQQEHSSSSSSSSAAGSSKSSTRSSSQQQQQQGAEGDAALAEQLLLSIGAQLEPGSVLLGSKPTATTLALNYKNACGLLSCLATQQEVKSASSSSSSGSPHPGAADVDSSCVTDLDHQQQQQQQQGLQPPWLLPLLLTATDLAEMWPGEADRRLYAANECVELLRSAVQAAPNPEAATALAAQLLPRVARLDSLAQEARQLVAASAAAATMQDTTQQQQQHQQRTAAKTAAFSDKYYQLLELVLLPGKHM